ncbi:hypothetical protein KM043_009264 [Ampulex compressa]|nr:hypothetical protein KM043_009264 [Ampulex compressa]
MEPNSRANCIDPAVPGTEFRSKFEPWRPVAHIAVPGCVRRRMLAERKLQLLFINGAQPDNPQAARFPAPKFALRDRLSSPRVDDLDIGAATFRLNARNHLQTPYMAWFPGRKSRRNRALA